MSQQTTIEIAPAAPAKHRLIKRWFFINVALFMILFSIIAFAPEMIDTSVRNVPLPLPPLAATHAIVSTGFLLLLLSQPTLVATGRTDLHRRLGIVGAVLAVAFVVITYLAGVEVVRRGFPVAGDPGLPPGLSRAAFVLAPNVSLLVFGILLGAALYYRHRPDVHKRLMLLAVLGGLTSTPVAHLVGYWSVLQPWAGMIFPLSAVVFLSVSAVYDRAVIGRIHPVSLWVPLAVFVSQSIFFNAIVPSAAFRSFAEWLTRE
jgi:hypothetical protein